MDAKAFLLYALYLLPLAMLGVMATAIVSLVREGRYRKEWLGFPTEAPRPRVAVANVMAPIGGVLIWALLSDKIGMLAFVMLATAASVLGCFVYLAAAKRHAEQSDGS